MTSMLLTSRTWSVAFWVMATAVSELDPVGGGHHFLGFHIGLVDAAHGDGIAPDGDWHADQAAGVEVLDGVERSLEVGARHRLVGVEAALGRFEEQHGGDEALDVGRALVFRAHGADFFQHGRFFGVVVVAEGHHAHEAVTVRAHLHDSGAVHGPEGAHPFAGHAL